MSRKLSRKTRKITKKTEKAGFTAPRTEGAEDKKEKLWSKAKEEKRYLTTEICPN